MDVVQTTLRSCKGSVRVQSKVGSGTKVTLTLPLSMAVTRVLLVETQGRVFGVPFELVTETVHVPRAHVAQIKGAEAVTIRDRVVPISHLSRLLQLPTQAAAADDDRLTILLVRLPMGEVGIVVDGLHEAVDIMLKPLEGPLASLPGYLGASLLGDGRALLILSLVDLFAEP